MKKKLFLAFLLLALAPSAHAESKWKLQTGLDLGIFVKNFNPIYRCLIGLDLGLGYALNPTWSIWYDSTLSYATNTAWWDLSTINVKNIGSIRCNFGGEVAKPYLRTGCGIFTQLSSSSFGPYSDSSFVFENGIGLECPAGNGKNLYLEAKADLIFISEVPTIIIPLQFGLIFDL